MAYRLTYSLSLLFFVVVLFITAGCASAPIVKHETEVVKVYVPVVPDAPKEIMQCGDEKPQFRFHTIPDSMDARLRHEDFGEFRQWVDGKGRCIEAWRAWGGD